MSKLFKNIPLIAFLAVSSMANAQSLSLKIIAQGASTPDGRFICGPIHTNAGEFTILGGNEKTPDGKFLCQGVNYIPPQPSSPKRAVCYVNNGKIEMRNSVGQTATVWDVDFWFANYCNELTKRLSELSGSCDVDWSTYGAQSGGNCN